MPCVCCAERSAAADVLRLQRQPSHEQRQSVTSRKERRTRNESVIRFVWAMYRPLVQKHKVKTQQPNPEHKIKIPEGTFIDSSSKCNNFTLILFSSAGPLGQFSHLNCFAATNYIYLDATPLLPTIFAPAAEKQRDVVACICRRRVYGIHITRKDLLCR